MSRLPASFLLDSAYGLRSLLSKQKPYPTSTYIRSSRSLAMCLSVLTPAISTDHLSLLPLFRELLYKTCPSYSDHGRLLCHCPHRARASQ
ncbi:hypothetical protein BV20DRAFT_1793 [Pilatotrama ljubarskyi]|nr:hypothetical protein BV20DRAFT_1793 [Pilatotrama ljubarskyi]